MNRINLGVILALFVLIGAGFGYSFPGSVGIIRLNPVHTSYVGGPSISQPYPISHPGLPSFGSPTLKGSQCGVSPQIVDGTPYYTIGASNPCGSFPYKVTKVEVKIETNPYYSRSEEIYMKVQAKDYKTLYVYKTLNPGQTYTYTFKPGDRFGDGVFPSWMWLFEVSSYPHPQFFKRVTIKVYYEPQNPEVWMYIQHKSGYNPHSTTVYCWGEEVDSNIQTMKLYVDNVLKYQVGGLEIRKNVKFNTVGTHTLKCVAIARNGKSASTTGTVYVKPAPDFFVPGYLVNLPTSLTDEDDFVLNFSVMNIGDEGEDASVATVPVQVYLDGNLSWSQNVYVPGGSTVPLSANLGKQLVGNHTLLIIVDPNKTNHDKDYSNNNYTTTFEVVSANHSPIANFYWDPEKPLVNQTVIFYDNSTDPDNNILSYDWDFGDGYTSHGATTMHVYRSAGTFFVTLTVTDAGGLSSTTTKTLHVLAKPTITIFDASPTSGHNPLTVTFRFSASDVDSKVLDFILDYGDGNQRVGTANVSTGYSFTHTYLNQGIYNATLTVTDVDGLADTQTVQIDVAQNHPPSILMFTANQTEGFAPLTVQFFFTATDPDNDAIYYTLDFGDNTSDSGSGNSATLYHTYSTPGQFVATLTVSDSFTGGLYDSKQILITVNKPLPDLVISAVNLPQVFQETKNATITVNITNIGVENATDVELGFACSLKNQLAMVPLSTVGTVNVSAGETVSITFNWAPPSYGNYTLYFGVDPSNKIGELNETNNDYTENVYVDPLPDFAIDENSIAATGLMEGHSGVVSVTTLNVGHTSGTTVVYLISNGTLIGNETVTIDASGFETVDFQVTVPVSVSDVTYTIRVDPNNVVDELNETNNEATKTFSVDPDNAPVIDPIPDQNVTVGDTLQIRVNATDPDGDIIIFSDNTSLFDINATTGEIVYTANSSDVGTHIIEITASDGIKSTTAVFTLTVSPQIPPADLVVDSIDAPSNVWSGETVLVNVTISNIGNKSTGAFWVSLGDGIIQYKKVDNLDPGSSVTVTFNWTAPNVDGDVTLVSIADVYDNVTESNETNNNATVTVHVTQKVFDASVNNVSVPATVNVNESFNISFEIGNNGNQDMTIPVVVYLNGTEIYSENITLSPGATAARDIIHTVSTEGSYVVEVVVDPNDIISESNETNNNATKTFTAVNPQPNQLPIADAGPEVWAKVGTPAEFNASNSYDPDGTIVSYDWDFGDGTTGAGEVVDHIYNSTGLYTVTLIVTDNRGGQATDTTLAAIWNNTGLPDFVPYVETLSVVKGENSTVNVLIYNLGNVSNNTTVVAYLNKGTPEEELLLNTTILSKAINKTLVPVVINYNGSASEISFTVIVDPDNNVTESNETNNEITVNLTVMQRPVATFIASPTSGYVPLTVHFNASNSYDPDGTIVSYDWGFGDGITANGEVVDHIYSNTGTYTAKLVVTDNDGLKSEYETTISVSTRPSGGGGGGGFGGGYINPNPPKKKETLIIREDVVTYHVGNLTITRDYKYDPKENVTVITTVVYGSGKVQRYKITDTLPKTIVENIANMTVTPYPDDVIKADPVMAWVIGLGEGQTFTYVYRIPGKVSLDRILALPTPTVTVMTIPKPVVPTEETNETTTPTVNTTNATTNPSTTSPITGLITFAQSNLKNLILAVLLAVFIVLVAIYFDVVKKVKDAASSVTPLEEIHEVNIPNDAIQEGDTGKPEDILWLNGISINTMDNIRNDNENQGF